MSVVTSGSCLCGTVGFEVTGSFDSFFLCHCKRCQKDTETAHAANLFSSQAELKWLRGEENVRTYRLPHTRHAKCFCIECGSALPMVQMDGTLLVVPAGSIDGAVAILPHAHICVASQAEWAEDLDNLPRLPGLPA